jgi:hypothetical protein
MSIPKALNLKSGISALKEKFQKPKNTKSRKARWHLLPTDPALLNIFSFLNLYNFEGLREFCLDIYFVRLYLHSSYFHHKLWMMNGTAFVLVVYGIWYGVWCFTSFWSWDLDYDTIFGSLDSGRIFASLFLSCLLLLDDHSAFLRCCFRGLRCEAELSLGFSLFS